MPTDGEGARAQARVHAMLRSLAEERLQARLHAAGQAWTQSRPGMLVQQYRGSEFHDRTRGRHRPVPDPARHRPGSEQRRLAVVSAWAGALGWSAWSWLCRF